MVDGLLLLSSRLSLFVLFASPLLLQLPVDFSAALLFSVRLLFPFSSILFVFHVLEPLLFLILQLPSPLFRLPHQPTALHLGLLPVGPLTGESLVPCASLLSLLLLLGLPARLYRGGDLRLPERLLLDQILDLVGVLGEQLLLQHGELRLRQDLLLLLLGRGRVHGSVLALDPEVSAGLRGRGGLFAYLRLRLVAAVGLVEILIEALLSLEHRALVTLVRWLHGLVQSQVRN